ncbi:MAG: hypothetical protein GY812_12090 [Actinomycetia bacterium]|nr:hypothetical protein [Actinomycetes bacterium]
MKKGRHRRYEEARALKRGGDLDIESIFDDISGDSVEPAADDGDSSGDTEDEYGDYDRYADDDQS